MTVYHTFNRYLPAIGRVLQVLRSYGATGTMIEICNRDLARAAECSAGRIPALLRTLEADGEIERVTGSRGSLIMLTDRSGMSDRISSDQDADREIATRTPDRSETPGCERSTMVDPPTPPIRNQHDSLQQQPRMRLYDAIVTAGGAGVVEEILDKNPSLTIEEFTAMRAAARGRGSRFSPDSIALVFWCLQHNQPLHTAKESGHERPRSVTRGAGTPAHYPERSAERAAYAARRTIPRAEGARRDAAPPAQKLTAAEIAALPKRGTARLQALLEQRARQGGSGHSTE